MKKSTAGHRSKNDNSKQPITKKPESELLRADLQELLKRLAMVLDEKRPEAVKKRHAKGQRMIRENIEDLCGGSFIEYGALTMAAQRRRRSLEDLMEKTPADGLVAGIGAVNAELFDAGKARCMIVGYDYTVLAGTQGYFGHKKKDRVFRLAFENRLPVVLFAEGGGGRPGDVDTDSILVAGLDYPSFALFAKLSGRVPLVGIVSGRCFAGNAVLLGCCDVIIATKNTNVGVGGPIMVEGGRLGVFQPEDIGPMDVQVKNGVVDIAVEDEAAAVAAAKKYLSYFQGDLTKWESLDQTKLRNIIPEQRRRGYDIRTVIKTLADKDSFLELRPKFGPTMITGFIRIEGKPFGLIANNCLFMAGAIESEGADKAARLMQICNAHGLPVLSLTDTPGFMVGPEIEKTAQVRHVCRMFLNGAHMKVPFFTVFLRRGYGLGAMAMAKGGFHEPMFTIAWPTGEFGGMGLEGAIKTAFKKELEAIEDLQKRNELYESLLGKLIEKGKAISTAEYLEIDAVIDPAETRHWIMQGLKAVPPVEFVKTGHDFIDAW